MATEKPEETPKNPLELTEPARIAGKVIHAIAIEVFGSRDGFRIIFPRSGDLIQRAMQRIAEKQLTEDKKFYKDLEKKEVGEAVKDTLGEIEKGFELQAKVTGSHMRMTREWWQDFKTRQLKKVNPALKDSGRKEEEHGKTP